VSRERNLGWLREELARILNIKVGDVDQAYAGEAEDPWSELDSALNEAYEIEVHDAANESDEDLFKESDLAYWPSGSRTFKLPDALVGGRLIRIDDESHKIPGTILWVLRRGKFYEPTISLLDRRTLQWGVEGPGENKTLRIYYLAQAQEMHEAVDEPRLVPPPFRYLLVWSAGIIMRAKTDTNPPAIWVAQANRWRERWHMALWKTMREAERPGPQNDGSEFADL
jgi:hypothetical protein